jgi:peptidoglycan/xylan/chitin deacetylase (PgdA/CDA1 family)
MNKSFFRGFAFVSAALFIVCGFLLVNGVFADTVGPINAGTGSSVSGVGTISWSNPGNITITTGNKYATVDVSHGSTTRYLEGTNYGFSIPDGATISGIKVAIQRKSDSFSSSNINDSTVKLVKGGDVVGSNKASSSDWSNSFAVANYGGASDLWGTTWTPAEINDSGFGVALSVYNQSSHSTRTAEVNYMQITVYYTFLATKPVITIQPVNQTISDGGTANLAAEASGSPTPDVKWQVSADNGVTWDDLFGETNTTLVVSSANISQSGYKYHAVFTNSAGSVTSDAAMLKVTGPNSFDKGMVSLSFDDGWQSIYDNAIPILNAAGFKSSQSIISNYIGTGGYMDQSEIDTLYATGHDIISHTKDHSDLTTLSTPDLQSEIYGSRDYLIKNVGKPVDSLAYPYDSYNSLIGQALLGAGYLSGRTVDGGFNDKSTDRFALGGQAVERGGTCDGGQPATTLAQVQSWIDTAAANNTWLILVLHQIDNIDANCYGYTPEMLQSVVDYLKTSDVDVVTISEGLHKMPGMPTAGDTTNPVITQDDISVPATASLDAVVDYSPLVSDNTDTGLVAWCTPTSGSTFSMGTASVVCSVADSSGNIGSKTFNVNVLDQTAPIISLDGDNPMTIQVHNSYIEPGASVSDNFDTGLVVDITGTVDTEVVGTYTVYYNATDSNGNSAIQVTRTVNVVDDEAPSTSDDVPAAWQNIDVVVTLTCTDNASCLKVFYTLDGSNPDTSFNYVDGATNWQFTASDEGQYTVKYFGVDESGNQENVRTATNQLMIDKTSPVLNLPADITAEATSPDGADVSFTVTSTDTNPASPEASCDHVSGSMFALGSTAVSCSATDDAGNISTNTFNIIVADTTPPIIFVPEDVTKSTTNSDGIAVTFDVPTVTDTVDGTASVTCDKNSGDIFPVGATTVACAANDASGNTVTKTFKVTVSLQQVAIGGGGGGGLLINTPASVISDVNSSGINTSITMPAVEGVQTTVLAVNNDEVAPPRDQVAVDNTIITQGETGQDSNQNTDAIAGSDNIENQPVAEDQSNNNPNPFAASLLSVSSKYFWPLLIILIILIIGYGIYYYLEKRKNKK